MATPTIRQFAAAAASGASATVNLGAGTAVGDLLLIWHGSDFDTAANMPTPTTSQTVSNKTLQTTGDAGSTFPHMKVWSAGITVAGAQTTTVAPTPSNEEVFNHSYVIDGSTVDLAAFMDGAAGGGSSTASTSHVAPAVSPATSDALLICGAVGASGGAGSSYTPPSGMTERTDSADGTFTASSTATLVLSASGSTGTKTFTFSPTTTAYATASIAVKGATVAAGVPYNPQRSVQVRDPGEAWWIQKDRRDANTVGTAANPVPAPLDSAWQAGGRYWHGYNDVAYRFTFAPYAQRDRRDANTVGSSAPAAIPAPPPRTVTVRDYGEVPWSQAPRRDPALLTSAQLENELLGGADDVRRHAAFYRPPAAPQQRPTLADQSTQPAPDLDPTLANPAGRQAQNTAALYVDRRECPQQRTAQAQPDPVPADPTLSGWWPGWLAENRAATHTDRRLVPQQRPYISDPSFYPTVAPTDPLTVAWGAGGTYWLLYNRAATHTDRRLVPQQRDLKSDPLLLLQALLENELLGGADDLRRRYGQAAYCDRREYPQQRVALAILDTPADPLQLTDNSRRAYLTPAYWDRREVPQQPNRCTLYFDAGPGVPPLTLAFGAGGRYWHLYNRPSIPRPVWPQRTPPATQGDDLFLPVYVGVDGGGYGVGAIDGSAYGIGGLDGSGAPAGLVE